MKILNVKYSRNGSGTPEPFFTVLFEDNKTPKEWEPGICGNKFIATFKTAGELEVMDRDSIRVSNLKNFNLNFDGREFGRLLSLQAINEYCTSKNLMEISWSAAAFPDQYKIETKLKAI